MRRWLESDGLAEHFRETRRVHGRVDAMIRTGPFLLLRTALEADLAKERLFELTEGRWTAAEYEERWAGIVDEAIGPR